MTRPERTVKGNRVLRRPVQAQAGRTVLPNYSFHDSPAMDAFLIPGGFGTRQEMHNRRLHEFVRSLQETTLLASVCAGSWVYGRMGAGYDEGFIAEVARVMDYHDAYELYRSDFELATEVARVSA